MIEKRYLEIVGVSTNSRRYNLLRNLYYAVHCFAKKKKERKNREQRNWKRRRQSVGLKRRVFF